MTGISLEPGEKIVWQGVINRGMLLFSLIGFLIPILVMGIFSFTQNSVGFSPCGGRYQMDVAGCLARNPNTYINGVLLGSIIIGVGLILLLLDYFWHLVQQYTVTTKRVIIKSGLIHTDYRSINYDQIKGVLNDTGWLEKMFGFGNVKMDTGATYPPGRDGTVRIKYECLTDISTPDTVYEYIHSAIAGNESSVRIPQTSDTPIIVGNSSKRLSKITSLIGSIILAVMILWPRVSVLLADYQQRQQSQVQFADNIKVDQGHALLGPLQMEKATKGKYPATLQDSSVIQSLQTVGTAIPLNDFTYQMLDNGNSFNLCIQLSTGQKCWSEVDIPK